MEGSASSAAMGGRNEASFHVTKDALLQYRNGSAIPRQESPAGAEPTAKTAVS